MNNGETYITFQDKKTGNNVYYQTLRLFNEKHTAMDRTAQNRGFRIYQSKEDEGVYSSLRFVGVGGQSGKEEIHKDRLFGKLKAEAKIKLAIGITMYQEKWKEFESTMTGVVQGILDLYLDQDPSSPDFLPWTLFKD